MLLLLLSGASSPPTNDGLSWHWDRETPNCSLVQTTADGNTFNLTRSPGQDETSVSFTVRSPRFWKGLYEGGSVVLSNGTTAHSAIRIFSAENDQYWIEASVKDTAFTNALARSSTVTIAHPSFGKFTASIRDVGAAMGALRTCEDGKMRDWGIDVPAYWALSSRPRPIGAMPDLFDSHLYPAVALDRNVERNVIAKLEIGPDGSVTSCSAPGHFGYPQFVDAACKVLKTRAHFEPARDASGKVVAAPYVLIIAFRMRGF